MKLTKNKAIIFGFHALIIMTVFSSCTARMIDFTIISSKNINLNVKKDASRVVGKKSGIIKGAVDNAIESAGSGYDAIVDGVVYSHDYYFVFVAWTKYHVEGTPIKTTEQIKK
jgi:hypothetical protein